MALLGLGGENGDAGGTDGTERGWGEPGWGGKGCAAPRACAAAVQSWRRALRLQQCQRALGCRWGGGGEAERGCEGAWSPRALFPSTDPMENGDTEARVGCSGEGGLLCSLG